MKKLLLSLIAVMSLISVSAQSLTDEFKAAETKYASKDFAGAIPALETFISKAIDDEASASNVAAAKVYLPKCYFMLGGAGLKKGDYDSARANFTKSAEYAELYDDVATMTKSKMWIGKTYELQGGKAFNDKDYATALPIFENGYASDPRNAKMANWLGSCYCETGNFEKGMEIFGKVAAMGSNPKYAAEAKNAENNMVMYATNKVADLQKNKDYDGVITLADALLAKNPNSAIAAKVRLQAYSDKKDYAKVFELADAAAALQTSEDEKSNIYFILGAAYNAKEMKSQAIETFKKVVAGPNAATAAATVEELSKE